MPGEFDLIREYFEAATGPREDVLLGIGDDCALLRPPPGQILAVTSDTLVSGRHFAPDADPESLGHKALAVNLSDLAAMGARPAWASLCLTLPAADRDWLAAFMRGFAALAGRFDVSLVGGDTTRGPLAISLTLHGLLAPDQALRRDAARPGDVLYVTGTLGDAGLALRLRQAGRPVPRVLAQRLDRPEPRVEIGRRLAGYARCAIDISDGLAADLGHVCARSGAGAVLEAARLPLSPPVRAHVAGRGDWGLPLSAGDDYELLFSVPPERQAAFERDSADWEVAVSRIGHIEAGSGVRLRQADGQCVEEIGGGYDHFSE